MSTTAPQQNSRRNQRQKKTTGASVDRSLTPNEDIPNESPLITTPSKPRRKRNNQRSAQSVDHDTIPGDISVSPLTPPRTTEHMYPLGTDVHISPIATNGQPNGKSKKGAGRNGQKNLGSTTPKPQKSQSPGNELPSAATPAKPTQIYAGPTFHASPAASSLPLPKFFSKSMPQVNDKNATLQAMMHEEQSEGSTGDESPTMRNSILVDEHTTREESPLDVLFQADRADKARKQMEASRGIFTTPNDRFRAASASPARIPSHNHSRQPTDGSIFPLEMDGESRKTPSPFQHPTPPASAPPEAHSPAGNPKTDKAKSEALKHLLFQKPQDSRSPGSPSSSQLASTSTTPGGQYSPNGRSRSSSPYSSTYGGYFSDSKSGRPQSSQLRKEVWPDTLPELGGRHLTTPTPSRTQDFYKASPHESSVYPQSRNSTPPVKFEVKDALRATIGNDSSVSHNATEAMEDKIRQMLKLDNLPRLGVR